MIGFSPVLFSILYIEKRFFQKAQKLLWLKIIGILTISGIISATTEILVIQNFPVGWITFFSATIAGGVVFGFTVWLLGYISEDEKMLVRHILKFQPEN